MGNQSTVHGYQNPSTGDLQFLNHAGNEVTAFRASSNGFPARGVVDNITAHAGGGQTNATLLTGVMNRVVTVASGNDSVLLPPAVVGLEIKVVNVAASNSLNVFPSSAAQGGAAGGDSINALSANSAYAQAAAKVVEFTCFTAGVWNTLPA